MTQYSSTFTAAGANKLQRSAGRRTIGQVLFTMGVAQPVVGDHVPGRLLIALLGDLGVGEATARSAILRLRRMGWVASRRSGRESTYAPTPQIRAAMGRHEARGRGEDPGWDGTFHAVLYVVPEHNRGFRDALRYHATALGYGLLQSGVLIAPVDRWTALAPLLDPVPPDASLRRAELLVATDDRREVAAQAWPLEELAARHRARAESIEGTLRRVRRHPPSGAPALRALAETVGAAFTELADDPGLPSELLPEAWSAPQLYRQIAEAFEALGPAVTAHVETRRIARASGRT